MTTDDIALKRIDHVRMFVGNARQSAYFYRNAFGFEVVAYAGLETGVRDEACYVLRQGQITFVLASPLSGEHPDAQRLVMHGDGVQSIALEVGDVPAAFDGGRGRGAKPAKAAADDRRRIRRLRIRRDQSLRRYDAHLRRPIAVQGRLRAGLQADGRRSVQPGLVPPGRAQGHRPHRRQRRRRARWATGSTTTARSWGFRCSRASTTRTSAPTTRRSMSKVVADGRGRIKFPINEPAKSRRRSQIDEFLEFYGGPGVQHIAMATGDIISSVRAMVKNDVSFLKVPPAYYEMLPDRVGTVKEDLRRARRAGHSGRPRRRGLPAADLHQAGRRSADALLRDHSAPGARSFGKGNFKALFEAIEREQARRGTL